MRAGATRVVAPCGGGGAVAVLCDDAAGWISARIIS